MRLAVVLVFLSFVGAPLATSGVRAQVRDTRWVWDAHCRNPTFVAISLRLDGAILYRRSIPICREGRGRRYDHGSLTFRFRPRRPLVWYGYRSDSIPDIGDTTAANTSFEIHIWQAGADTDAVLLGYNALARDGYHMNSIYLLWPAKADSDTIAPGLVIETQPERRRAGGAAPARP